MSSGENFTQNARYADFQKLLDLPEMYIHMQ